MRVVVVGGGVVGLCCAVEATQAGMDVLLLDHVGHSGGSASLAAGAMLGVIGEVTADELRCDPDEPATRAEAARLWPPLCELLASVGPAPRIGSGGSFVVATRAKDLAHLKAMKAEAGRLRIGNEDVGVEDLPVWFRRPGYAPLATLWVDEGWIDPRTTMEAIRGWLDQNGVDRREGQVVRCTRDGDSVTGVELLDGATVSGSVVLSAGVATTGILEASGLGDVAPRVVGGKGVSLRVRGGLALPTVLRTPNREFACGVHAVPASDGTTLLGATNRVSSDPAVMGAARLSEIGHILDEVRRDLHPGFGAADLVAVGHGHRPTSVDGRPLAGASEVPGLALATGTGRNGVLIAPLIARWVVAEVAGQAVPENRYGLEGRAARVRQAAEAAPELLARSGDDIVDWLVGDDGRLGAVERHMLARVLEVVLPAALGGGQSKQVARARELLDAMPIPEALPEMLLHLAGSLPGMAASVGGGTDSARAASAPAHRSRRVG